MADPTAFYEAEDDELLSSLAVPAYQAGVEQNYEDEYRRLQDLEQHAYDQQMGASQDQSVQLDMVPQDVKRVRRVLTTSLHVRYWLALY